MTVRSRNVLFRLCVLALPFFSTTAPARADSIGAALTITAPEDTAKARSS